MNPSEEDLECLRQRMVDEQLLRRDIRDKNVISVFRKVPRHRFVDPAMRLEAYGDFALSIGKAQTISQPYMVALMAQVLDVKKNDKVLEIGTGSGYETAILAELGREIFSIERIEGLAKKAGNVLEEFGYKNIHIKTGDGTLGWQEHAPFDRIAVTASSEGVPQPLLDQLREGGRMVMPVGPMFTQRLLVIEKEKGRISERDVCGCVFVPLIGEFGWRENSAGKDS